MLKLPRPMDVVSNESFAIKRRRMTFAEAEKERAKRLLHVALLNAGDIIGLESYICELNTHINTARCVTACDCFYILKHNFLRLQKRHGTQGLTERLRELAVLELRAYPHPILHLPLFNSLMKKQLALFTTDEQPQQHTKQSWLLHLHNTNQPVSFLFLVYLSKSFRFRNLDGEIRIQQQHEPYTRRHISLDHRLKCNTMLAIRDVSH